jgi:hypothetical protein
VQEFLIDLSKELASISNGCIELGTRQIKIEVVLDSRVTHRHVAFVRAYFEAILSKVVKGVTVRRKRSIMSCALAQQKIAFHVMIMTSDYF